MFLFTKLALCLIFLSSSLSNGEFDADNDILDWHPPKELARKYPYFLSGVDKEGSPIMIVEYGKWDIRATGELGGQPVEDFKRYTEQMWTRWFHYAKVYSTEEKPIDSIFCLSDLSGFDLRQFSHAETVRLTLNVMKQFATAVQTGGRCRKAFIINTNYLFQTVYNLGKPLLGDAAGWIELYGTNAEKWKPLLLKEVDKDQLPDWLGGSSDHKPVKVFG